MPCSTPASPPDPRLPESWPAANALVPHVDALVRDGLDEYSAALAAKAGSSLYWQGDLAGAHTLDEDVLVARRELLGPRPPNTLTSA